MMTFSEAQKLLKLMRAEISILENKTLGPWECDSVGSWGRPSLDHSYSVWITYYEDTCYRAPIWANLKHSDSSVDAIKEEIDTKLRAEGYILLEELGF